MGVLSKLVKHDAAPEGVLDVPWRTEGESEQHEAARAHIVCDWLVRAYTPTFLRLVPELVMHAEKLETGAGISRAGRVRGQKLINAATRAASNIESAVQDVAWDEALYAAGNAAGNAALYAAEDAAGDAAWNATWNAAWSAAGDAAWNAARNTGDAALQPAVQHIRSTYLNLIGIVATADWLSDKEQAAVSQWIPGGCLALWFRGPEAAKYESARAVQASR